MSAQHRVIGTGFGGKCLFCLLGVEERLEEQRFEWPKCPGRVWTCQDNDDGASGHLLVENSVGDVYCFYCDKPVEDLPRPARER
jgi:hypothetical protein